MLQLRWRDIFSRHMQSEAEVSTGKRVRSPSDPISAYNLVVACYNVRYHCTAPMHPLPNSRVYQVGFRGLRLLYSIPLLLFALIPLLNILVLLTQALLWLLYELAYRIHAKNATYVANPFQHMIFSPAICAKYAVNNTFLPVSRTLCPANLDNIENRLRQDGKVNVMFYNGAFRRYYECFQRVRWVHLGYLTVTVLCFGVSLVWTYPVCGLDVLRTGNSPSLL